MTNPYRKILGSILVATPIFVLLCMLVNQLGIMATIFTLAVVIAFTAMIVYGAHLIGTK